MSRTFGSLLAIAIEDGLSKRFDSNTAKAIKFYADPRIALKSPDSYERSLNGMLGEYSNQLISDIMVSQRKVFSLGPGECPNFSKCVEAAKYKFIQGSVAPR